MEMVVIISQGGGGERGEKIFKNGPIFSNFLK